jgi:hypothetical protein
VRESLDRLLAWIKTAPEITPDPFDVKAHPWFARKLLTRDRFFSRLMLKAAYVPLALFPVQTRRLLRIRPQQTAGGAAWLAQGYVELFRLTNDKDDLQTAELWLKRLLDIRIPAYEKACWGLPFDWPSSATCIPANSPLLYTTWHAAQAFMDHFEVTNRRESLEIAVSALQCLLATLNKTVDEPRSFSLSYSPHDRSQVYNTNALAGGLMCKIGLLANEPDLANCGQRMLNWVADGQRPTGSWDYFSPAHSQQESTVDHYHTAMTLQGLLTGSDSLGQGRWDQDLERGLRFYFDQLFDRHGRPKFTPESTFPIDVMSVAEGVILLSRVQSCRTPFSTSLLREALDRRRELVKWACRNLQSSTGAFYWRLYPGLRIRLFSYRWGQGAMLKALACCLDR